MSSTLHVHSSTGFECSHESYNKDDRSNAFVTLAVQAEGVRTVFFLHNIEDATSILHAAEEMYTAAHNLFVNADEDVDGPIPAILLARQLTT